MKPSGILAGGGGSRHGSAAAAAATVGGVTGAAAGAYGAGRPRVAGAGRFQSSIRVAFLPLGNFKLSQRRSV
jgi:hypothetical protein